MNHRLRGLKSLNSFPSLSVKGEKRDPGFKVEKAHFDFCRWEATRLRGNAASRSCGLAAMWPRGSMATGLLCHKDTWFKERGICKSCFSFVPVQSKERGIFMCSALAAVQGLKNDVKSCSTLVSRASDASEHFAPL